MRGRGSKEGFSFILLTLVSVILAGCGAQPDITNVNLANSGANKSLTNTANKSTTNTNTVSSTMVEASEPSTYQAKVTLHLQTVGAEQNAGLPTLAATVARTGTDRRMEFTMPAGGRVVYLDKAGTNYLILPEKKQYAELNRESLGFDVRRLLMPEQIVNQVKSAPGVERVGEEKYNGRDAVKYRYAATANTQTRAGQVQTDSFLIVDKETGLPLRSETVLQSQSGGNVQGYNGVSIITEISDVKTDAPETLFEEPTAFQKIDSEQIRSQVDMIFNTVALVLGKMMSQGQASPAGTR